MENKNGFVIVSGRDDGSWEPLYTCVITSLNYKTGEYTSSIEITKAKVFKTITQARVARTRLANTNKTQCFCIKDNENIETLWTFNGCFTSENNKRIYKAELVKELVFYCTWKRNSGELKHYRKTKTGMIKYMTASSKFIAASGCWNTAPNGDPEVIDNGDEYTIIWPLKEIA